MSIKWPLIRWHMRQMYWFNLAVGALVAFYVLSRWDPFATFSPGPLWFPPLHAAAIAWFLGRSTTPAAGYLHLQGFSRDELWWHSLLSALGCVRWAVIPAALLILTPLRSAWQDLLENPAFPYMAPVEARFLWIALWEYAVSVPLWMYVAARWSHPARGNGNGLLFGLLLTLMFLLSLEKARLSWPDVSLAHRWPLLGGGLVVGAIVLVLGRKLAREGEVQP